MQPSGQRWIKTNIPKHEVRMRVYIEQEKAIQRKREQEQGECNIGEQHKGGHRWPGEKTVKRWRALLNIKACRHSMAMAAQCYVKICELSASRWAETRRLLGTVLCPGITGASAKCRFWNSLEHQAHLGLTSDWVEVLWNATWLRAEDTDEDIADDVEGVADVVPLAPLGLSKLKNMKTTKTLQVHLLHNFFVAACIKRPAWTH